MPSNAWLGLVLIATACTADPLIPGQVGGSNGGAGANSSHPVTTGNGGATGQGGTTGVGGTTGTGGTTGDGVDAGGAPCGSTADCAKGQVCTTEDGVCNAPPGCGGGVACPRVCYGNCRHADVTCGAARCGAGTTCCNSSCGVCVAPGAGCTKQVCTPPAGGGACTRDSDCRLEADYCTGCDCRPLATSQSLSPCAGPGVRCLLDPCSVAGTAACVNGYCVIQ